ncbi:MAG: replication initiator protein A [Pseudomonadota bacterium]
MAVDVTGQGAMVPAQGQGDFFICDILDAIPKDDLASMEHPIFSLSTRPDRRILSYDHGAARIEITPSVKGLATIHDKDVLIYCISQLMAALNAGRQVNRTLELTAHDLLLATRRETSGDGYRRLREALERLSGTRIVTTIPTGGVEVTSGFGLIDHWEILRRTRAGRMISARVTLSDWLYRAVVSKSVLTLSREYFGLRKPLERRVYEIARKHCGRQGEWRIRLETLCKKSGSTSPRRVFRKMIRDIAAEDRLPDYAIALDDRDVVIVTNRAAVVEGRGPRVSDAALEAARQAAPGYDVQALLADWQRHWMRSGRPRLRDADKAFVAFAAARHARAPLR